MSGILGIWNRDGTPLDRDLLGQLTRFLAFRGPDAQEVWQDGAAGLGHTLLRTTRESAGERQPCTLDGRIWIAADARVDARAELIAKLESAGRREVRQATDAELILHAYHVWGEECPQYLLGDFAFLIWDGPRRVLFGARDHFGVKPFYYAEMGHTLLCSNTLNCLRLYPGISDKLNDLAVADFLLFEWNQDPAATFYADIRRLAPGHCLISSAEVLRIREYWKLPEVEIRYRHTGEYLEHFRELFEEAVSDRLRTDRVAVSMSGGLDSTLVAAVASRVMGKTSADSGVRAYTIVFERLFRDQEKKYSGLAAEFLRIPIEHVPADDFDLYQEGNTWLFSRPEPQNYPLIGMYVDLYRRMAGYTRVVLSGLGSDPAIATSDLYIVRYLKWAALPELITGIGWCLWIGRRIPRLGIRSLIRRMRGKDTPFEYPFPVWLNPEIEQSLELRGRWDRMHTPPSAAHSRSKARQALASPLWPGAFEIMDPGITGFPLEWRYPFYDVRVAGFLAGIPPLPWCQEKTLLRAAGRGILPDAVLFRPKTPLAGSPVQEKLRRCGPDWWNRRLDPAPELERYVNLKLFPRKAAALDQGFGLMPLSLNYWLRMGRRACGIAAPEIQPQKAPEIPQ